MQQISQLGPTCGIHNGTQWEKAYGADFTGSWESRDPKHTNPMFDHIDKFIQAITEKKIVLGGAKYIKSNERFGKNIVYKKNNKKIIRKNGKNVKL